MSFTFYCPQGHLLEGNDSQQGTQGRCPTCASVFVFPSAASAAGAAAVSGGSHSGPAIGGGFPAFDAAYGPGVSAPAKTSAPAGFGAAPRILKILCPRGHELPTPEDLVGTTTICPYCNQSVVVSMENSVEHRDKMRAVERERDEATGRFWLRIAMVALVLVGITFAAMIVYVMKNRGIVNS
jgi:hypothetical protein